MREVYPGDLGVPTLLFLCVFTWHLAVSFVLGSRSLVKAMFHRPFHLSRSFCATPSRCLLPFQCLSHAGILVHLSLFGLTSDSFFETVSALFAYTCPCIPLCFSLTLCVFLFPLNGFVGKSSLKYPYLELSLLVCTLFVSSLCAHDTLPLFKSLAPSLLSP